MSLVSSILEFLFLFFLFSLLLASRKPTFVHADLEEAQVKVGASLAVAEESVASTTKKSTSSGVSKKERGCLFFKETR